MVKAAVEKKVSGKSKRQLYSEEGVSPHDEHLERQLHQYPRDFYVYSEEPIPTEPVFEARDLFEQLAAEKKLLEEHRHIAAESVIPHELRNALGDVRERINMVEGDAATGSQNCTPPQ